MNIARVTNMGELPAINMLIPDLDPLLLLHGATSSRAHAHILKEQFYSVQIVFR